MTCAVAVLVLALLTAMNFLIGGRRVLYPPFVYSLVWCLDTFLFGLHLIEVREVHSITWGVIVLGAFCFSAGCWVAGWLPKRVFTVQIRELAHPTTSNFGKQLLLLVCTLGIPLLLHEVMTLGAGSSGGVLMNARQASVNIANAGNSLAANPASAYLPVFSVWVALLLLIEKKDKYFWIALTVALGCCVLSTGRTLFLLLFSGVTSAWVLSRKKDSIRDTLKISVVPALLFVSFFIGAIFLNKNLSDFAGNFGAIFSSYVIAYFVGPIAALDYVLTHPAEYASVPHHTFEFFLKILSLLPGVSFKSPPRLDEFLFVPFPANVYTIYKPFVADFGFLGMLLAVGIIGFAQAAIYRRALAGGKIAMFLSAILMYSTLMSIFDDVYTGFQQLILSLVLVTFYYGVLNRLRFAEIARLPSLRLGIRLPRLRVW
jgi:oligosaccharide repeat unit polymerase